MLVTVELGLSNRKSRGLLVNSVIIRLGNTRHYGIWFARLSRSDER